MTANSLRFILGPQLLDSVDIILRPADVRRQQRNLDPSCQLNHGLWTSILGRLTERDNRPTETRQLRRGQPDHNRKYPRYEIRHSGDIGRTAICGE